MAGKRSSRKSKSRRPKKIKKRASAARKSKSRRSSRPKSRTKSRSKARAKSRRSSRPKSKRSARPKSKRAATKRPVHRTTAKRASKQPTLKQVGGGVSLSKVASPRGAGVGAKLGMKKSKLAAGGAGAPQGLLEFEDAPPPAALTRDPSLGPPPMPKKRRGKGQLNMLDYPGESLTVGMPAPEFSLPSTLGRRVTLSEFRGKRVILYFYPKDDTPGCTMEACGFRDSFPRIESKDAIVLGVSLDDELSHERFAQKFSLPFPLLSDKDAAVSRQYGTYKEKNLYGRSFWGIERTTFVIDRDGKVEHVFRRVKVEGHAEEVMATLAL